MKHSKGVTSRFTVAVRTSRVCAYSVFAFFTAGSATAVAIVQKRAGAEAAGSGRAARKRGHCCSTVLTQRITVVHADIQKSQEFLQMLPANSAASKNSGVRTYASGDPINGSQATANAMQTSGMTCSS